MVREMVIVPYDDMWPDIYIKERNILLNIFGNLIIDVQHFGSTSIKGLSAKPIIDIIIVANDISQIDEYNQVMEDYGYSVRGENGIEGRRYFVKLSPDNSRNHTHHIHIYQKGNQHIFDELMFRDYLRIDNEAFKEYERIKIEASLKFRYSPREYVNAKDDCIMSIMDKANLYYKHKNNPYVK
ncbi:GrpB family protein [Clostridium chromiireducens]|uniref:GrpB family protein n=1 Tax=Clostridium chromiireducens TaxID=225345 RepID=A0A399IR58_9CLOT|nr:GrpB family protein [Clostridium chromiireducens]RII35495.1 GrpB family protein [Clostridium chromiireducens]